MVTCWRCKKDVYKKDVADERKRFPGGKYEYLCVTCKRELVDAMIAKTRQELGLPNSDPAR